jgi:hypothetical protein
MSEFSSALVSVNRWNREVRFGNLLKDGGISAPYWYTVEVEDKVFVFDAQALVERSPERAKPFRFSGEVGTAMHEAATLAEQSFGTFGAFSDWVRANFHCVEVYPETPPVQVDIDRLSRALAEPSVVMPVGLSREEQRQFICSALRNNVLKGKS